MSCYLLRNVLDMEKVHGMESFYMRLLISKFLILSLLLVTMHSALANEYTQLPVDGYAGSSTTSQQVQSEKITLTSELPPGENITSSECNVCHTAHILLILAPGQLSLGKYVSSLKTIGENAPHPAPMDDIPHPPIILI